MITTFSGSGNYILPNSLQFQLDKVAFHFFLSILSCELLLVHYSYGMQMSRFQGKGKIQLPNQWWFSKWKWSVYLGATFKNTNENLGSSYSSCFSNTRFGFAVLLMPHITAWCVDSCHFKCTYLTSTLSSNIKNIYGSWYTIVKNIIHTFNSICNYMIKKSIFCFRIVLIWCLINAYKLFKPFNLPQGREEKHCIYLT